MLIVSLKKSNVSGEPTARETFNEARAARAVTGARVLWQPKWQARIVLPLTVEYAPISVGSPDLFGIRLVECLIRIVGSGRFR
jgi:hypothetical protein